MNCTFEGTYQGGLLSFFFFHGSKNILQGLIEGWLGDALWQGGFHDWQKGLVVRVDNVPQEKMWSMFTLTHRRPVSICDAQNPTLGVVPCPDDVDVHVQVPRCCLQPDVVCPAFHPAYATHFPGILTHVCPVLFPASLPQTLPLLVYVVLAHLKVGFHILDSLGVGVDLDELVHVQLQLHEAVDGHSSALEEELDWGSVALLDQCSGATVPVSSCGSI